jgi:hypothetical protein
MLEGLGGGGAPRPRLAPPPPPDCRARAVESIFPTIIHVARRAIWAEWAGRRGTPAAIEDAHAVAVADHARVVIGESVVEAGCRPLFGFLGLNSKCGASTCSMRRLAAMALRVSLTASVTASSEASGSAIMLVKRNRQALHVIEKYAPPAG